ncbi:uncharacterized protein [Nicotiana tomentosiformis]|uniref:uncharacterized protein n=1 Tax=Nicotiana tomentosiformis TaxID=4098 RepID=UPI00388C5D6B
MESVKDLWEDIKHRLSVGNGARVQQLKSELANCTQGGQNIVAYYGRLKMIWDELTNYDLIPIYRCGRCKCNLTSEMETKREEEKVHQFLMGLDDEGYGTMRSNILSIELLPNLNRVYSRIVQQERVMSMTRSKEEKGILMSFAMQIGARSSGGMEGIKT